MRAEELGYLLGRNPTPLLRLHLSSGATFDITDPDLVYLSHSTVQLLLPRQHNQMREAVISLLHIVWVEVIDPPG
jgi:hypothetical protein